MFITNDTARNDLACQMAMAAYTERLAREEAYRQAVRSGEITPAPFETVNISDRH